MGLKIPDADHTSPPPPGLCILTLREPGRRDFF